MCGDTHIAALLPLSILRPSQQQLNHHSKTLSYSLLLCLLPKQRKRPLTNGTTFWKPCPSALPTSQWQNRLTSSDLYKRSHLTGEKQFILKGVNVHNTSRRKLCKTTSRQETQRPTARPRCLLDRAHHHSSRHTASSPWPTTAPAIQCRGSVALRSSPAVHQAVHHLPRLTGRFSMTSHCRDANQRTSHFTASRFFKLHTLL